MIHPSTLFSNTLSQLSQSAMTITDEMTAATPSKDDTHKKLHSAVEFEPPLACVRRILKHSLPSSTNVGKDASAAFARACGIFIIYLTACANDFAREHKRQTITANDVLAAVQVSVTRTRVRVGSRDSHSLSLSLSLVRNSILIPLHQT
jgi:histone H3/H4